MTISPHFVCLSMIVSGRYIKEHPTLGSMDCLAYAIEHENEDGPLPPLVQRTLPIFGVGK